MLEYYKNPGTQVNVHIFPVLWINIQLGAIQLTRVRKTNVINPTTLSLRLPLRRAVIAKIILDA